MDYSDVVIAMMRKLEPELCFLCADCAEPGALGDAESYDFCIDKATDLTKDNCSQGFF